MCFITTTVVEQTFCANVCARLLFSAFCTRVAHHQAANVSAAPSATPARVLNQHRQGAIATTVTPSRPTRPASIRVDDNYRSRTRGHAAQRRPLDSIAPENIYGAKPRAGASTTLTTRSAALPATVAPAGAATAAEGVPEEPSARRRRVDGTKAHKGPRRVEVAMRSGTGSTHGGRGSVGFGKRSERLFARSQEGDSLASPTGRDDEPMPQVGTDNRRRIPRDGDGKYRRTTRVPEPAGDRDPWSTRDDGSDGMWMSQEAAGEEHEWRAHAWPSEDETSHYAEEIRGSPPEDEHVQRGGEIRRPGGTVDGVDDCLLTARRGAEPKKRSAEGLNEKVCVIARQHQCNVAEYEGKHCVLAATTNSNEWHQRSGLWRVGVRHVD